MHGYKDVIFLGIGTSLREGWAKEKGWTLENAALTGMEAADEWAAKWREKR